MSDIGERICNTRKNHANMTQNQLITAINSRYNMNISRNMLSNWERGKQNPSIDALIAISETLEVSTDYILKGKKEELRYSRMLPFIDETMEIKSVDDIYKYGVYQKVWDENNFDFCYKMPLNNMININIYCGDYILFHIQNKLKDGDIGMFLIDGEISIKRYYNQNTKIVLVDECMGCRPYIISDKLSNNFKIIAKAVTIVRKID